MPVAKTSQARIRGVAGLATISPAMSLLILEALGAGALLVFIVWWTMFSGRRRGERDAPDRDAP